MPIDFILLDEKEFSEEGVRQFTNVLKKSFGIHTYADPRCEGSDQYGLVLSSYPLSKKRLARVVKQDWE